MGSIPTHSTYWRSWIFEDTVKGVKSSGVYGGRKIEWSGVVMLFANGIKKGGENVSITAILKLNIMIKAIMRKRYKRGLYTAL